jgi:hypothetical protein
VQDASNLGVSHHVIQQAILVQIPTPVQKTDMKRQVGILFLVITELDYGSY